MSKYCRLNHHERLYGSDGNTQHLLKCEQIKALEKILINLNADT